MPSLDVQCVEHVLFQEFLGFCFEVEVLVCFQPRFLAYVDGFVFKDLKSKVCDLL